MVKGIWNDIQLVGKSLEQYSSQELVIAHDQSQSTLNNGLNFQYLIKVNPLDHPLNWIKHEP